MSYLNTSSFILKVYSSSINAFNNLKYYKCNRIHENSVTTRIMTWKAESLMSANIQSFLFKAS